MRGGAAALLPRPASGASRRGRAGRVFGAEHDDPHAGPLPNRTSAELVGGLLLDIHGWRNSVNRCTRPSWEKKCSPWMLKRCTH